MAVVILDDDLMLSHGLIGNVVTLPDPSQVMAGVDRGDGVLGTAEFGSEGADPDAVLLGVDNGAGVSGHYIPPAAGNLRAGVVAGAGAYEVTGTMKPIPAITSPSGIANYDDIRAFIESVIQENITTVALAWKNESYDPSEVSEWARVAVKFAGRQREVLTGSRTKGQSIYGTVIVSAFVLPDANEAGALNIIDLFSPLFNEQTLFLADGTSLYFESGERMSENEDSEWYQLTWSIPFKHDDIA